MFMENFMYFVEEKIGLSKIAFVDLETTGLSPISDVNLRPDHPRKFHKVLEIGACIFDLNTGEYDSFETLVNPEREIPWEASWLHGIKDEDVKGAISALEGFKQLNDFLDGCNIVWGFNSPFDLKFMIHEYRLAGENPPDLAFYDVGRLANRLGYGWLSLENLSEDLGVLEGNTLHRALPDAIQTCKCFLALIDNHFSESSFLSDLVDKHNEKTPVYSTQRAVEALEKSSSKYQPKICVTGTIDGLLRKEIVNQLEEIGYKYVSGVNSNIEFLVVGKKPGPSKLIKAEDKNVEIVSSDDFVDWLEAMKEKKNSSNK